MTARELESSPSLLPLYGKALVTGFSGGGGLPEEELVLPDITVDLDHLARYARVCGFRLHDHLPPTYLHVLAFPLSVQLLADRDFPFALPGLVHIGDVVTQHRPVDAAERPTLRVRTANLREHAKGRQFDVVSEATVDGETVWSETATILKKGGGSGSRRSKDGDEPPERTAIWKVPADTGRRYAAVSGDRNPIHLYPLTAKLFGFPRQIAHGMWTKARCLAALEPRLPASFVAESDFKKPLVLPATVAFGLRAVDGGWDLHLRDPESGAPHLEGRVRPVSA
jgi:hypothetical protein